MKKKNLLLSFISLAFLVGCASSSNDVVNIEEKPATLDDVSFPKDEEEKDNVPAPATLPEAGSEAVKALDITANLNYFNNNDLHNLNGQWNGYGIHHPYIYKFNDTYYLYTSTPSTNVGIRAYKSNDLISWSFADKAGFPLGYISKARETFGAYSPRVIYHNDLFYLYFNSPSGFSLFTSETPEGPFTYHKKLNYSSSFSGYIYKGLEGKLFFISGEEESLVVYDMKNIDEVDLNSRAVVESTIISQYQGETLNCDYPVLSDINGVLYLTYSQASESYTSYRSDYVVALEPNYSSSYELAKSFRHSSEGPLLVATNEKDGDVGLGDLSLVEGLDMVSYYGVYTSREDDSIRRLNISPIFYNGAKLSLTHRETHTPINQVEVKSISDVSYLEKNITDENLERYFTYEVNAKNIKEIYFGYKTNNNTFVLSFENNKVSLIQKENGLAKTLLEKEINSKDHNVKVVVDEKAYIYLDDYLLVNGLEVGDKIIGKVGYLKGSDTVLRSTRYVNVSNNQNEQQVFKPAEGNILSSTYYKEMSSIYAEEPLKLVTNNSIEFGKYYLDMSKLHDYARWLVDVKEDGHYGLEMVYNASFGYYRNSFGLRVGANNPEYIYTAPSIKDTGYVRTMTAEFDVVAGLNEILVENLSNGVLRLIDLRLVKLSSHTPSFNASLASYASKGVYYVADFTLNSDFNAHQTYEGARSFAYVGDNTISDFALDVDVAFSVSLMISGHVMIGFRCNHFAFSRKDNNESSIGYFLEISQFQMKLVKHNYGYGVTMGVMDLSNSIDVFATYHISMVGNTITVYKESLKVFSVVDPYAISSGHLAFGGYDTVGLIRNLDVHAAI